jgi:Transmembrane secretion effector
VSPTCQRPASRVIVTDSRSEVREFLASRRSRTTHQQAGVELIAFTFLLGVGATSWELYRDGERPNQFVEVFRVSSWEEHLRQHEGRLTATDQVIEEAARPSPTLPPTPTTCYPRKDIMVRIMIGKTPMMPMRDGVRLATDLLRLDDAPPAPVLLILPIIER